MLQTLIPQILLSDFIGSPKAREIFGWGPRVIYFSRGRTALLYGIKMLAAGKPEKRRILVPAFLCEETLWPLRESGFKIDYYAIDKKWAPDLREISLKMGGNTLAVLAVHYFGVPQEFGALKTFCESLGTYLVEDCAHALFGRSSGRALGSLADLSVFSIRKFLPLPDGGALVVNNLDLKVEGGEDRIVANRRRVLWLKLVLRSAVNYLRTGKPAVVDTMDELCPRADLMKEKADFVDNEGMSNLSRRLLHRFDLDKIAARRRQNYNRLANDLADFKGVELAYPEAKDGWNPYVLPIYVDEDRQFKVLRSLRTWGIMATDWPTLPPDLERLNKEKALCMQKRIVLLPLHQNIGEKETGLTVKTLKDSFK